MLVGGEARCKIIFADPMTIDGEIVINAQRGGVDPRPTDAFLQVKATAECHRHRRGLLRPLVTLISDPFALPKRVQTPCHEGRLCGCRFPRDTRCLHCQRISGKGLQNACIADTRLLRGNGLPVSAGQYCFPERFSRLIGCQSKAEHWRGIRGTKASCVVHFNTVDV